MNHSHPPMPPGPHRGNLIMGNALEFGHAPLQYMKSLAHDYGGIAYFHLMTTPSYLVSDPDLVHEVLVQKADKFHKQELTKKMLKHFLGSELLLSETDVWRRQRRLMQPAFHSRHIESFAQMMVDSTLTMLKGWHPGDHRDAQEEMIALTLRIISQVIFHSDVEEQTHELRQTFTELNELMMGRMRLPLPIPEWLPTAQHIHERKALDVADKLIHDKLAERRASSEEKSDLLSMLLMAKDENGEGMNDHQVRDELMTFVFAGHETTALALTWAFYALSQNPQVETRMLEEMTTAFGNGTPTLGDVSKLPYTEMFNPPVWLFGRDVVDTVELGGYSLSRGSTILISPHVMHHNPQYFPEPERFDPERFSAEHEEQRHKFAYVPFSSGPRVCIGNSFALLEARLLLATIVPRYHLKLVEGHRVETEVLMTQHVKGGLQVELVPR